MCQVRLLFGCKRDISLARRGWMDGMARHYCDACDDGDDSDVCLINTTVINDYLYLGAGRSNKIGNSEHGAALVAGIMLGYTPFQPSLPQDTTSAIDV